MAKTKKKKTAKKTVTKSVKKTSTKPKKVKAKAKAKKATPKKVIAKNKKLTKKAKPVIKSGKIKIVEAKSSASPKKSDNGKSTKKTLSKEALSIINDIKGLTSKNQTTKSNITPIEEDKPKAPDLEDFFDKKNHGHIEPINPFIIEKNKNKAKEEAEDDDEDIFEYSSAISNSFETAEIDDLNEDDEEDMFEDLNTTLDPDGLEDDEDDDYY